MKVQLRSMFDATPMRVVCAWCRTLMCPGREPVSHGICPECAAKTFAALDSNTQPEAKAV